MELLKAFTVRLILKKGITKRRNKGKFYFINQDIKNLLDRMEAIYKRPGYENYRLVPWLFPSPTRIDSKRLNKPGIRIHQI